MKRKCTADGCKDGKVVGRSHIHWSHDPDPSYDMRLYSKASCPICNGTGEVEIKTIPLSEIYAEEVCGECGKPRENKHKGLSVGDCVLWEETSIFYLSNIKENLLYWICLAATDSERPDNLLCVQAKVENMSLPLSYTEMKTLLGATTFYTFSEMLSFLNYISRADAFALALEWSPCKRKEVKD